MSYDVRLHVDGVAVTVPNHSEGATYAVGGISEADLDITYNYAEVYNAIKRANDQAITIHDLHGKRAADMIPVLEWMVLVLGTKQHKDYWSPTPGNAGYALSILLQWAKLHPDAVFEVT